MRVKLIRIKEPGKDILPIVVFATRSFSTLHPIRRCIYKILKTVRVTAFKYFLARRISADLRKNNEDQRTSPLNIKVHVSSPKQTSWNVNITKPLSMVLIWRLNLHQNAKRVPFLQRTLTSVRLHNALQ